MDLHFQWSRLDDLSSIELHELLAARGSVFVVEQKCAYQDPDRMDLKSWHLRVRWEGEFAGCARVVDPGVKVDPPSIGRVMTLAKYRHFKLGRRLVEEAVRFTEQTFPAQGIQIDAQVYLRVFYESMGFQATGAPYDEDCIPHVEMMRAAATADRPQVAAPEG